MKLGSLSKSKYLFIFLIIIVFLFYKMNRLLIYSSIDLPPNPQKASAISSSDSMPRTSTIDGPLPEGQFRILLWTKYFGGNQWTQLKLNEWNCSYSNCLLTDDRRYLDNSDAVLFHWRDIDTKDIPQRHRSDQKWVLYNWEPPHYTFEEVIKPLIKDIDWWMTYRRDSDIYVPYGSVQKCDRKWNNEDLFDKKTKSVAWIVSNCLTPGNREGFVKELATHIDVDIFGYCGQQKCKRDESCFEMIQNTYKFYLSFENSLCKDYVTEKLFRTIDYDIIPVVYGSADYKQLLPQNSFINAKDFPSVEELSKYLKLVASDKQKYNSYLKWKSSHCVQQTEYRYFCDLCQKLNQNSIQNSVINRINDSNQFIKRKGIEWWYKEADCQQRNNSISRSQFKLYSKLYFVLLLILFLI